jgi:zinc protease
MHLRHSITGPAVLLTLACTAVAAFAADVPARPKIQKSRLGNGLEVLLAPDPNARAADVALWYRAGTAHEPRGSSGMAHLLERLTFRAAADSAHDYRRLLLAEGATASTSTTPDYTSFFATVPPEAVALAIRLEAQRMAGAAFETGAFDREREFVQRERRAFVESNPVGAAVERLFAAAYPGHGYGRPVLGSDSELGTITLDRVTGYRSERYVPANAVLTVTGRFDPKTTLAAIKSSFGALPRGANKAQPSAVTMAEPGTPEPRTEGTISGRFSILLAGWRGPIGSDASLPAMNVVSEILGDPSRGRLQRELTGPGKPFLQVRAAYDGLQSASLFYTYAIPAPGVDLTFAESELTRVVESLATEAVRDSEFAVARARLELRWRSDLQTVRGRAMALGNGALTAGDPEAAWTQIRGLQSLTPVLVQQAAQKYLVAGRRAVVALQAQTEAERR